MDTIRLTPHDASTLRTILPRMPLFMAVARASSITSAARELGMSRASLSEAITGLEETLGCTLLHRTTRSLHLTDAGTQMLELCERVTRCGLDAIELADWHDEVPRGRLRVSCNTGLMARELVAPVLAQMVREHGIQTELHTSSRPVDMLEERFDAAIRIGFPQDSSLRMSVLGKTHEVFVASERVAASIERVEDLDAHPWIALRGLPLEHDVRELATGEVTHVVHDARVIVEDTAGIVDMLENDAGVSILPDFYVPSTDGVVDALPGFVAREITVFMLLPPERWRSAKLRRFAELLTARWQTMRE